jgi:hypothetical protein
MALCPFIIASAIDCDDRDLSSSLIRGSLAFTLPAFPLSGSPGWLRLPLDFTRLLSQAALPWPLHGSGIGLDTSQDRIDSYTVT